jgi:probable O-glycosylation ligase (exosortase A-associated)
MRDVLVTLLVFGAIPFIVRNPSFGMVMWIWISVMNPHSQGWGFARTFPFAAIIAAVTVLSMFASKERYRLPTPPVIWVFIVFMVWMSIGTLFSIHPDLVFDQWLKVMKILGMSLVVQMLLKDVKHVKWLIWAVVVSIGYYGVKGGLFTLRGGGQHRVWGPNGTFIDGNNEIALALVMIIPLMYYLMHQIANKWGRRAMVVSMLLCAIASLGTYSRGAALAMAAMLGLLWLKSKHKLKLGLVLLVLAPLALVFMPDQWHARIDTINTYEQDASAMGRINAWWMAFNLANDRPLFGGGFDIYDRAVFGRYAPVPDDVHAAHSIYFQVLGEHGWVGLLLYLAIGWLTWRTGSWVVRNVEHRPDLAWASELTRMVQVSLLGFMVGGAFLSLAYFDVPYYLMSAMVAVKLLVEKEIAAQSTPAPGQGEAQRGVA